MSKIASEKTVATIFTIPAKVKTALYQKMKKGSRSRFVAETLAAKLGVSLAPTTKKTSTKQPATKKAIVKKVTMSKKKKLFGLFK